MSKPAGNGEQPERAAFTELEAAVGTVLEQLADVTTRAEGAELLKRFTGDEAEAGRLLTRLKRLQDENEDLHSRLETGRAGIDKLLAKIKFLEEQR